MTPRPNPAGSPEVNGVRARKSDLTKLAAECHRAKWQFDLSDDYQPSKAAARELINRAFSELHRIGDLALQMREPLSHPSPPEPTP